MENKVHSRGQYRQVIAAGALLGLSTACAPGGLPPSPEEAAGQEVWFWGLSGGFSLALSGAGGT